MNAQIEKQIMGLEGIVAATTRLSLVDGVGGHLLICGYSVEDLAPQATFEEVAHLLWTNELPDREQLSQLRFRLASHRKLPTSTVNLLREVALQQAPIMDALRMAVATLTAAESPEETACKLVAVFPTIVGTYWRFLNQQKPFEPRADLSHAQHC